MLYVNPSMKDKYPYWYAQVEREERQREIDNMVFMAELELSQFVDAKMKDIESMVNEIKNRLQQTSYNVETTINNKPMSSDVINREIKKMAVEQFKKALK